MPPLGWHFSFMGRVRLGRTTVRQNATKGAFCNERRQARSPAGVIAASRRQSFIQHGPPFKRKMPPLGWHFSFMGRVRLGRTTVRQNATKGAFCNERRQARSPAGVIAASRRQSFIQHGPPTPFDPAGNALLPPKISAHSRKPPRQVRFFNGIPLAGVAACSQPLDYLRVTDFLATNCRR